MRKLEKKARNVNEVEVFKQKCNCNCYCHCSIKNGPTDMADGETSGENHMNVY
ncbi:MAG: hypothetical protein IJT27_05005 [Clostridia bacterium]|nr:hypothetical protein [Clostridia bacterium]